MLKEAIRAFDGTAILVSHDRDFLDGLVERVYEFGGGQVREHIGGIYDFLRKKDIETLDQLHDLGTAATASVSSPDVTTTNPNSGSKEPQSQPEETKSAARQSYVEQKAAARERRRLERAVEQAEAEVTRLEQAIAELEAQLADGAADLNLYTRHADLTRDLKAAMQAWEDAAEQL